MLQPVGARGNPSMSRLVGRGQRITAPTPLERRIRSPSRALHALHFPLLQKRSSHRKFGTELLIVARVTELSPNEDTLQVNPPPPVLLWFKHDLRIDDHPGLHRALQLSNSIVPFFCFDPKQYNTQATAGTAAGARSLYRAVTSLRQSLKRLGSDLVIRCGSWEEEISSMVQTLGPTTVILAEEEIESHWRDGVAAVVAALPPSVVIEGWSAALFKECTTDNFEEWRRCRSEPQSPLDPSLIEALPQLPGALSGETLQDLLSPDQLLQQARAAYQSTVDPTFPSSVDSSAFETPPPWPLRSDSDDEPASLIEKLPGGQTMAENIADVEQALGGSGDWGAELATELAAGEGPVMEALQAYCRHIETDGESGGSEWQWKLGAAIARYDVPAAPDGCFPAIFGPALALGVVSRRRVYYEATKQLEELGENHDSEAPQGILAKLGWLLTSSGGATARRQRRRKAVAAATAAEAGDFHAEMARRREGAVVHDGAVVRHWRWGRYGILTDYLVAHPPSASDTLPVDAPAILLVHGFGAFGEHWRGNVAALAAQGFRVYAPTFPGYGRAEKPAVAYSQDLWRDFLADFVLHVVRRPVVAVGNSIGGFISASLAADFEGVVRGLVLVNSAGLLQEGYKPPSATPKVPSPPLFVVNGVSRALFAFLQGDVTNQLRRVYPVVPSRADEWLGREIARASSDPGALGVFRSVFYLPKPRALNYLVTDGFGGPTLVLQGAKDPLNDAPGRAKTLQRLCTNARIVMLDAGHCPHDETPPTVNTAIADFVVHEVIGMKRSALKNSEMAFKS